MSRLTILGAYAAYQTGLDEFAKTRTEDTVEGFLKVCRDRDRLNRDELSLKLLGLEGVVAMVSFHFCVIRPPVGYYVVWTLDSLSQEINNSQQKS